MAVATYNVLFPCFDKTVSIINKSKLLQHIKKYFSCGILIHRANEVTCVFPRHAELML